MRILHECHNEWFMDRISRDAITFTRHSTDINPMLILAHATNIGIQILRGTVTHSKLSMVNAIFPFGPSGTDPLNVPPISPRSRRGQVNRGKSEEGHQLQSRNRNTPDWRAIQNTVALTMLDLYAVISMSTSSAIVTLHPLVLHVANVFSPPFAPRLGD
ncbi:hypothetical protein P691DRAFT_813399 [Macrolepiota fuliginosa MF-IS2]|uniref:Uncharacterized protein n=1 Tax=Macrolepiota fuliginosa MF-IS2 TaxID=1400762 RepID=A0A9P5XDA2_9AGAR|nr:hypothetical protein P691DRAFT_813399 [Macrolepiota fuliginosa MF-IS2]